MFETLLKNELGMCFHFVISLCIFPQKKKTNKKFNLLCTYSWTWNMPKNPSVHVNELLDCRYETQYIRFLIVTCVEHSYFLASFSNYVWEQEAHRLWRAISFWIFSSNFNTYKFRIELSWCFKFLLPASIRTCFLDSFCDEFSLSSTDICKMYIWRGTETCFDPSFSLQSIFKLQMQKIASVIYGIYLQNKNVPYWILW